MKDPVGVGTYTYTITNNYPTNSAKAEGTDITVTITRNVSGTAGESTISLSTTESDAGEDDYVAVNTSPVKFTSGDANGAQKQVTIKTLTDADASEGKESFFVDLFKTKADAENGEFFEYTTVTLLTRQLRVQLRVLIQLIMIVKRLVKNEITTVTLM